MTNPSLEQQLESLDSKLTDSVKHKEREAKFAEEANERFARNVACFEKYYPDIASEIKSFETREDFCLHVTTTGHGNFVPKGVSAPIYSDDPIQQTREQIEAQTQNPVYSLTDYTGYPQDDSDTRIHSQYMTKLTRFMCTVNSKGAEKIKSLPSSFPTAIIFGLGLGYHIPLLLERTKFDYLFVIEPEFEQFFASLFCIDWNSIIQSIDEEGNCLFFHLGAEHSSFIKDVENIADDIGAFSLVRSFCYQHTPGIEVNNLIKKWSSDYFRFQFGHGFYNDAVTGFAHSVHHINNQIPVLTKQTKCLDSKTPVFIVGNGPSLDEAEEFIKRNHNNAIIVAAGTAIASLHKKGIPADFHVLVERPLLNYEIFGDILGSEEYKKVNLLGLNMIYPDTNARYQWSGIAVKGSEAGTCMMDLVALQTMGQTLPKIPYCNPLVANTALSYFLYMGFRNIYLFGVDNGSTLDGAHHSKDSIYKLKNDDDTDGYMSLPISGHTLPGNLGGTVVSNDLFMVAHSQLEKLVMYYQALDIVNVGGGAKIKNTISTGVTDLLNIEVSLNKFDKIEYIKNEYFQVLPIERVDESVIAIERLDTLCSDILSIAREEVKSREQASLNIKRQQRYLYAYRDTVFGHLFHLVKGALLYYHCPMITLLYSYKDEKFTLDMFNKLNDLWISYVEDIQKDYRLSYDSKCDWGF